MERVLLAETREERRDAVLALGDLEWSGSRECVCRECFTKRWGRRPEEVLKGTAYFSSL